MGSYQTHLFPFNLIGWQPNLATFVYVVPNFAFYHFDVYPRTTTTRLIVCFGAKTNTYVCQCQGCQNLYPIFPPSCLWQLKRELFFNFVEETFLICLLWIFNFRRGKVKCHILIDLLKLYFVSRNSILSVHVCRATIKDCKKNVSKFQSVFLIFWDFFLKNVTAKVELFLVLPKFNWKKIFQKFQKKMV
jgi:hypothetical protein